MLAEGLRSEGIPYVDLLTEFLMAASTSSLYKPNDTHWNIMGNELASGIIREYLLTQLP
jgi:hypothetical protein